MPEVLNVELRSTRGKRHARRQRNHGTIPAVLYGHGQENLSLTISSDELTAAVRHGSRLVELKGSANETALIREMQWDVFGLELLHVDLARVSADERIEVTVTVELRGEAPGVKDGGVVQQPVHELRIECPAIAIPEKLSLSINHLGLKQSLTVADLKLPEGVTVLEEADTIVAQCVEAVDEDLEAATPTEGAEPELIGRKPADEEEAEE